MAAATGKLVVVTGFKELDTVLKGLPAGLQRKFVRGALRKGGKRLTLEVQRIVRNEAYDTGALHKSLKVRALKRSRKRVGISVLPDREKLFANYANKHDGKRPHPAKGQSDAFYYAATIEFGGPHREPIRPMRRALYDNAAVYREYFKADLTQFLNEGKVTAKLGKPQGFTGKKFKK